MYDRDTKNEYLCIWQNLIRDHHTEKLSVHVQIKKLFMFLRKRAGIYHALNVISELKIGQCPFIIRI